VNVWLDHQKAANGGQPAGTPQSSVLTSTPIQGVAAAAAVGLAVNGSAVPSGTIVERSTSATLSPDEPAQPGHLPTDSTLGSSEQPAGPQANGVAGRGAGTGAVRSAVRALEFGEEPPAQVAGSSPLSDVPVSHAEHATSRHENGGDASLHDGIRQGAGSGAADTEPVAGAVSIAVEPQRSLPPDARLADASSALHADTDGAAAADGFVAMADTAAELRALLTMHRAEMRVASEQLRAQFEAGQVQP
jgi:hypothetical protein